MRGTTFADAAMYVMAMEGGNWTRISDDQFWALPEGVREKTPEDRISGLVDVLLEVKEALDHDGSHA
jgi:hypothetical protein